MLENEIKLYEADSEQSIEAQMNELAELEVLHQSKSASASDTVTQMAEQTSMLRKNFQRKISDPFREKSFDPFSNISLFLTPFRKSRAILEISFCSVVKK